MNVAAIRAVFWRDFKSYFGGPLGYLFVVLFILVTGVAAFYPDEFFSANKANLDLLSEWFPYLLALFVPAVTMATWAEERRQGTQELLFTLPALDYELVLGKYLACLAIYTVALLFTLSHVAVLVWLGQPDPGLMATTYLGYWLLGVGLLAVGMFASALTSNLTVAFIVGATATLALAGMEYADRLLVQGWVVEALPQGARDALAAAPGELLAALSPARRAEGFGRGVLALEDLLYFPALAWTALFATTLVVGRRHWTRGTLRGLHGGLRLASILVGTMSLVLVAQRGAARADVTRTGMLRLSAEARAVLDKIPADRPVFVQAWISPKVPGEWVGVRDALLRTLEELDARAGDRLEVAIHLTEPYSPEAERAERSFGIKPRKLTVEVDKRFREEELFMGLAFTCGPREEVIPFFDKGLPVQYELTRAIGVVADRERAQVGVLSGEVKMFGGFDFQSMNQSRDWQIVQDLRRQYEVKDVAVTAPIDTSLQVVVVPQPSSLKQDALDRLAEYLFQGGKALFLVDPYPVFNLGLAPGLSEQPRNPFQPAPPPAEKGNVDALMQAIGVGWDKERVAWDAHNPHPKYQQFPHEIVFVVPASEGQPSGFDEADPVTQGLQEVVLIFPGDLKPRPTEGVTVTRLLQTRPESGFNPILDLVEEVPFLGPQPKPPSPRRYAPKKPGSVDPSDEGRRTLAVRCEGLLTAPVDGATMKKGERSQKKFQAIVIADADLISDGLYALRREGSEDFDLDNVTFVSNCIDSLAGASEFIALRKQRPRHRTLTRLEEIENRLRKDTRDVAKRTGDEAKEQLDAAQKRLDEAVEAIKSRTDLDRRTKDIQVAYVREREEAKLEAEKRRIEDEQQAAVRASQTKAERELKAVKDQIRLSAVALPPLPALLLGLIVYLVKASLEAAGTSAARRRKSA